MLFRLCYWSSRTRQSIAHFCSFTSHFQPFLEISDRPASHLQPASQQNFYHGVQKKLLTNGKSKRGGICDRTCQKIGATEHFWVVVLGSLFTMKSNREIGPLCRSGKIGTDSLPILSEACSQSPKISGGGERRYRYQDRKRIGTELSDRFCRLSDDCEFGQSCMQVTRTFSCAQFA